MGRASWRTRGAIGGPNETRAMGVRTHSRIVTAVVPLEQPTAPQARSDAKESDVMVNAVTNSRIWRGTAPCVAEDGPSEHEQMHLSVPTEPIFRLQMAAAVEDTVSPPRENRDGPGRRSNDVTQMSVSVLVVIAMAVSSFTAAISASGVYWMLRLSNQEAQSQMQSDIRSIVERMESQRQINEADKRADAAERDSQKRSDDSTKQAVDSLRGVVQLLQLQMADLLKQRR